MCILFYLYFLKIMLNDLQGKVLRLLSFLAYFIFRRNEIGSIHLVWLTPYCDDQLSVPKSDQEICDHKTVNDT